MPIVPDREDDRSTRFWTWIFLAVMGLIPVLALFALYMAFDPNDYKAQIIEQVRKATGRELTLGGRIEMKLALRPTVEVSDVTLSNMEGGSRPEMLRVVRAEATLGLFALIQKRIEIDRLILEKPDLLLETDAQGRGNWRLTPAAPASAATTGPALRQPGGPGFSVEIREVRLADGTLTWRAHGTAPVVLPLRKLELDAEAPNAPVSVSLETAWNGTNVGVNGQVGSIAGLQGLSSSPWPLRLAVTAAGAKLNISGAFATPATGKGYNLQLNGTAPDLAALGRVLGQKDLPALRDVELVAKVSDRGTPLPEVTEVELRAGSSDLSTMVAGLKLDRLEIVAPKLDGAVKIDAHATLGGLAMVVGASVIAPLARLGPSRPDDAMKVEVGLTAGGAAFSARGSMRDPVRLAGADLAVAASVPDTRTVAPLFGGTVPALRDLKAQARLSTPPGGIAQGVTLRELSVVQAHVELSGDLTLVQSPRLGVQANLAARRINLDALRTAFAGAEQAAASPAPGRPQRGGVERAGTAGRLIPDTPLPFPLLRAADADVQLRADEVVRNGATIRNLVTRLHLRDGKLRLDPFSAELPAGRVTATLSADATQAAPPVALTFRSPGLALRQLYADLGREGDASGSLEVDIDLRGAGLTPRAIAAVADGHIGLAIVGGTMDNRLLNLGFMGDVLRGISLGELLGRGGVSQLRCFALRMDTKFGAGDMRALLLESSTMLVEGGGRLSLADESLALRLRVQPRLGALSVMVPVRVGGSLAAPRIQPDPTGMPGAAAQTATGAVGTAAEIAGTGVGAVTGALGLGQPPSVIGGQDACATQLAIARGGRAGPTPTPAATTPARRQPRGNRPSNPLQRLLP